jgi:hypothetical protein
VQHRPSTLSREPRGERALKLPHSLDLSCYRTPAHPNVRRKTAADFKQLPRSDRGDSRHSTVVAERTDILLQDEARVD